MAEKQKQQFYATGRRKEAVARVRLMPEGKGVFIVNGRDFTSYFATIDQRIQAKRPLAVAGLEENVDVSANVRGGGQSGQAGAVGLGIARCLVEWNPSLRVTLRREDLLTRDPRAKERKKYGRKGARRRFQWTKR
ncbi:MAG: 30S ribosomal protein S9 [Candidatus Omnitrophota bacterium]|nr:MAG: 30S ribosomal protein S9 [Candidatus Omnitrophota bacterium]